jgi:hypothetical protein
MPTFRKSSTDAVEVSQALRGPARATRTSDDPTEFYPVLGSLSAGLASPERVLHQLPQFHDGPARKPARTTGEPSTDRPALRHVSWELHRSAEIARAFATGFHHAREVGATIAYGARVVRIAAHDRCSVPEPDLSL